MSLANTMCTGLFTVAPSLGSEKNTLPPPGAAVDSGELPPHAATAIDAVRMRAPTTRKAIATPFRANPGRGNYRLVAGRAEIGRESCRERGGGTWGAVALGRA